ncbi:MAG: acyl-CoA dehydrogenase [Gammaproteobacteria bacterium]|nr:MAG: acyl-CoA dehydrogenase [Gammaproteobacteria bacterium]RLA52396.1 MAG: acyl-CoA dehydrogenase [Gammaproteobacteria bacterium]
MDFSLSSEQQAIVDSIKSLMDTFGDEFWLERDNSGVFPEEFYQAMAEGGWLGITMPEEYGGANLGVMEAMLMMMTVAEGGGLSAASAVHINIFGPHPIVKFGTDEQKRRWLPPLIAGEQKTCFGVTEANAGLDTSRIETFAKRQGDKYIINGQKIWTTTAQQAHKVMLLTRTTPREECAKPHEGITLFYADMDPDHVEIKEIEKMGRKAVNSNMTFYDNLEVSVDDRIGEEGKGFQYILHSLNPERILLGAESVGMGRSALARASQYAKDREVFGRPIGMNQSVQHPLAENWIELEAAYLSLSQAAWLYDNGQPCGAQANGAKYIAAEAGFKACEQAVMTHGGMGYAKEYHVERLMREAMLPRLAPVSQNMVLNFISTNVLGLPRSY